MRKIIKYKLTYWPSVFNLLSALCSNTRKKNNCITGILFIFVALSFLCPYYILKWISYGYFNTRLRIALYIYHVRSIGDPTLHVDFIDPFHSIV